MFFQTLQSLLQSSGKLAITLFPGTDGRIKVSVVPSAEKGQEAALATPLTLTGTAEELDNGFAEAVSIFTSARTSLAEQVEATTTILNQAKESQSQKAVKALKGKPVSKEASKPAPTDNDDNDEDENAEDGESGCGSDASAASCPAAAPATAGTDLSSLI